MLQAIVLVTSTVLAMPVVAIKAFAGIRLSIVCTNTNTRQEVAAIANQSGLPESSCLVRSQ